MGNEVTASRGRNPGLQPSCSLADAPPPGLLADCGLIEIPSTLDYWRGRSGRFDQCWRPPPARLVRLAMDAMEEHPWMNKHGLFRDEACWRAFHHQIITRSRTPTEDGWAACHESSRREFLEAHWRGCTGWQLALAWLEELLAEPTKTRKWFAAYFLKHRAEKFGAPGYCSSGDLSLAAAIYGLELSPSDGFNADVRLPTSRPRIMRLDKALSHRPAGGPWKPEDDYHRALSEEAGAATEGPSLAGGDE